MSDFTDAIRISAKEFRKQALARGNSVRVQQAFLKLAEDYETFAQYIGNLEEQLEQAKLGHIKLQLPQPANDSALPS
jgi:hypothetical protein